MSHSISITASPISLVHLRQAVPTLPDCGGYAAFEGIIRNTSQGRQVKYLEYEAYETLALNEMKAIAQEVSLRFSLKHVHVTHRTGTLFVGETAVIIQVLTGHRAEAFAGCQMMIDQIKLRVPIWKKEHFVDGEVQWVLCTHPPSSDHTDIHHDDTLQPHNH